MRSFAVVLSLCTVTLSFPQVSHEPQYRKVLLEEFTAINCGNCPVGHVTSNAIVMANSDDVVLVNMHAGPLATPSGSQPDFRNAWSTQLLSEFGVGFTPQGLVNRRPYNGATLLSSGSWTNASNAILALSAVVNMATSTAFDNDTRQLTVTVELYYTADSPGANDMIFVLLTEDHLNGPQANYGAGGPYATYDHRQVMRAYITPLGGDEVSTTTMGSSVLRTYTYSVPLAYAIDNCRVVAFVGEGAGTGYGEVHQVSWAPVLASPTGIEEGVPNDVGVAFPVPTSDVVTIPVLPSSSEREMRISDAMGRVVKRAIVRGGVTSVTLAVNDLWPGTYFYGFANGRSRRLVVVR